MSLITCVLAILESLPAADLVANPDHGTQMNRKRLHALNKHFANSPLDFFLRESILRRENVTDLGHETLKGYSAVVHYLYFYYSY